MTHVAQDTILAARLLDRLSQRNKLVLEFEPSTDHLRQGDVAILRRWAAAWAGAAPSQQVVMACSGGTSQAGRTRRLEAILSTLRLCGFPSGQIRYTSERIDAPPGKPATDVVQLRVISPATANAHVRSIRSFFVIDDTTDTAESRTCPT